MRRFVLSVFCLCFIFDQAASADFRFSPNPNKANLIKWRSWDTATFKEAKEANKPILLSLSAVWCHWCHVMDETTYSDDDVIGFINENFIPVPESFLKEVNKIFIPEKVVRVLSMKKDKDGIEKLGYPLEQALYLCFEKKCASVKRPKEAKGKINHFIKNLSSR